MLDKAFLQSIYKIDHAQKKMSMLIKKDSDGHSIGHICLQKNIYPKEYIKILKSLSSENLFQLLKLTNHQRKTIWSLYCEAGYNQADLLTSLISNPAIFCQAIEYFELNDYTLQTLVNIHGIKTAIRHYLLNLPGEPEHWELLERCLQPETNIGKFCAKEANHFGTFFQKGKERTTVTAIRKKIEARVLPFIPEHLLDILLSTEKKYFAIETKNMLSIKEKETESLLSVIENKTPFFQVASFKEATQQKITPKISAPERNRPSHFWFYTNALTVMASSIIYAYFYIFMKEECSAQSSHTIL